MPTPAWLSFVWTILAAFGGGVVGGWIVAYRIGGWRSRIEEAISRHEERLDDGQGRVREVPVIQTRLDTVIEELREIKKEMRDERSHFVRHEACDARHSRG